MTRTGNSKITFTASDQQQKILEQRWEQAGIGNDFIFSCIMRDKSIFLRLMQLIFPELKLTKVENHSPQMTFAGPFGSKSVRFDVYSEIDGRVFDVEMQLESRGNEARRTRYYQCMMDEQDDHNLALNDGTAKVFLNTQGSGEGILPELKNFLDLINGKEPVGAFCEEVEQRVQKAKLNAETRRDFMEFEYMQMLARKDAREAGLKEGLERGHQEERLANYGSLVRDGILSLSDAMKRSGLNKEQLQEWVQLHPRSRG